MKLFFLVSCASNDMAFSAGREYDLPDARAKQYISEGIAVPVDEERKAPAEKREKAMKKSR